MAESETITKLRRALDDAWLTVDGPLEDDLRLLDIDGLDSVSRVRLLLSIEEIFGIELTPKEHSDVATIGELVALIEAKREKR